jgi:hypothetical protein
MCNLLCKSARLRELCSSIKDQREQSDGGAGGSGRQKLRQKWEKKPDCMGCFLNICKKIPPDHLFFGWEML